MSFGRYRSGKPGCKAFGFPLFLLLWQGCFQRVQSLEAAADSDSLDWKDLSAAEITSRVTGKVQPGSIVLFHNAAKHTPAALPAILENLISQGYTIVPISQLILDGECDQDYTIDHTGRQFPKAAGTAAAAH